MAVHKLMIDDFVTIDYELIAIHSSLEDYRLAYFINRELSILLEKSPRDITVRVKEGERCFSRFIFEDEDNEISWNLIQNRGNIISRHQGTSSLFGETGMDVTTSVFLLPEFKKVDYVIKIENTGSLFAISGFVERLLTIKHISTAYTIDRHKLKSKNNLIF